MASLKKAVDDILRTLTAEHGCDVSVTKAGHWRVSKPGKQPLTMSRTPSDQRAVANIKADVRRYWGIRL